MSMCTHAIPLPILPISRTVRHLNRTSSPPFLSLTPPISYPNPSPYLPTFPFPPASGGSCVGDGGGQSFNLRWNDNLYEEKK